MDAETRRRAADALRAIKRGGEGWFSLSDAVLGRPAPRDEVVARLADLIDPGEDVTVDAYDLISEGDRETLRWVREHGGLENVRDAWDEAVNLCATIGCEPNDESEMLQALGGCTDIVIKRLMPEAYEWTDAFADAVDFMDCVHDLLYTIDGGEHTSKEMVAEMVKRLMPVGMEWPRFEDGEQVRIGDEISWRDEGGVVNSIELQDGGYFILHAADGAEDWILPQYFPGERVKRPAPKVLDADGVEIRVGDTVYHVKDGSEMTVYGIEGEWLVVSVGGRVRHDIVTHRAPVIAANGRPLRKGETVWDVESGTEYEVVGIHTDEDSPVRVMRTDGSHLAKAAKPSTLTHQRPVLDADGVPIKVGDTVYFTDGREQECDTVVHAKYDYKGEPYVQFGRLNEAGFPTYTRCECIDPSQLTHTKPEHPDSIEKVAGDIMKMAEAWCSKPKLKDAQICAAAQVGASTIGDALKSVSRRCKALAERGQR